MVHTDIDQIIHFLQEEGLIDSHLPVELQDLEGGVSSDIKLISNGPHQYVLKEAREQLKVKDLWEADVSRNFAEQAFIEYVGTFRSDAVPRIIYRNQASPYFIMEYLASPLANWKSKLLDGEWVEEDVFRVIKLLADIHNHSRSNPDVEALFDYSDNFFSLRIEPYLVTTGIRNPNLKYLFENESNRLKYHRETLVHGDFSPKNILVSPARVVLLDHEVANFGDPAFDLAFLMNHLILKDVFMSSSTKAHIDLITRAWTTYFDLINDVGASDMAMRTSRLLLMLMLARVDGKSPVEYLNSDQQGSIREIVYKLLPSANSEDFISYVKKIYQW
ncbi:MAG: aminoglycoside phosphotransferase family protein [Saprospiraceae bacterium]|nr:aminoglycoside phosphotransferase family protein [Saprospiraceae bacterium]